MKRLAEICVADAFSIPQLVQTPFTECVGFVLHVTSHRWTPHLCAMIEWTHILSTGPQSLFAIVTTEP